MWGVRLDYRWGCGEHAWIIEGVACNWRNHKLLTTFCDCCSCRKKDDKEEGKTRKPKERKPKEVEKDKDDGEWETIQRKSTRVLNKQEMKKMLFGKEVDEIDHAVIKNKRDEIVAARGKKTVDRNSSIENLKLLLQFSNEAKLGVGMELLLLVDLIATIYDIPSASSCMKDDVWDR